MPFAGSERRIPRLAERFPKRRFARHIHRDAEVGLAGIQHGAAWHTDRSASATHAVGIAKAKPLLDELVEIWGRDVTVTPGPYRVWTLVICEQDDDVGLSRQVRQQHERGQEQETVHCKRIADSSVD